MNAGFAVFEIPSCSLELPELLKRLWKRVQGIALARSLSFLIGSRVSRGFLQQIAERAEIEVQIGKSKAEVRG